MKIKINPYITDEQIYLYKNGKNYKSYYMLGSHPVDADGVKGYRFAVWAPNAQNVSVVGDFNNWDPAANPMKDLNKSGIWYCVVENAQENMCYKYFITTKTGETMLKIDPYAFSYEIPPKNASCITCIDRYQWKDEKWISGRNKGEAYNKPMNIYEVHPGSWRFDADRKSLSYRELAETLVPYLTDMGYTHLELLPVNEHPYDGSWGYQVTGYYAVTSRFGTPEDFMYLVDKCHQNDIGVILDWVPGHFPKDSHALARYDGTVLYEYADTRIGEHEQWGTLVFNYRRHEVISFLISSAVFLLDKYHIDGIRVDAVTSMLYLNYGRNHNHLKNEFGGIENTDAIKFLQQLNVAVNELYPHTIMIAEESTSWPMVTKPVYLGGLGFDFKWNMGWMNDILKYMCLDPIHRKYHHSLLTFQMVYAFSENYILPLSHDEVVHGKKSLLDKMPGDYWQKFAGLRLLFGFMMAHPGKKLLFMGGEFGQFIEWKYYDSLDWHLLDYDMHKKLHQFVRQLNDFYLAHTALWEVEDSWEGFKWINPNDCDNSIISFIRIAGKANATDKSKALNEILVVICNFTPVAREGYRIGVPEHGIYWEIFNTDNCSYGGSGYANNRPIPTQNIPYNDFPCSIELGIPPLAAVYLKIERSAL